MVLVNRVGERDTRADTVEIPRGSEFGHCPPSEQVLDELVQRTRRITLLDHGHAVNSPDVDAPANGAVSYTHLTLPTIYAV